VGMNAYLAVCYARHDETSAVRDPGHFRLDYVSRPIVELTRYDNSAAYGS